MITFKEFLVEGIPTIGDIAHRVGNSDRWAIRAAKSLTDNQLSPNARTLPLAKADRELFAYIANKGKDTPAEYLQQAKERLPRYAKNLSIIALQKRGPVRSSSEPQSREREDQSTRYRIGDKFDLSDMGGTFVDDGSASAHAPRRAPSGYEVSDTHHDADKAFDNMTNPNYDPDFKRDGYGEHDQMVVDTFVDMMVKYEKEGGKHPFGQVEKIGEIADSMFNQIKDGKQMSAKQLEFMEHMLSYHDPEKFKKRQHSYSGEKGKLVDKLKRFAKGYKNLNPRPPMRQWDKDFLNSIMGHIKAGRKLSPKQLNILRKTLDKNQHIIDEIPE